MASEPNQSAEEKLKRYAAERRKQAPSELHPATRQMLQGEVSRVYGSRKSGGESSWRKWLVTPSFAWATACVAMLGISVLVLQRPAPKPTDETALSAVPETAPVKEELVLLKEEKKLEPPLSTAAPAPVPTISAPRQKAAEPVAPGAGPETRQVNRDDSFRRREVLLKPAVAERKAADETMMEKDLAAALFSNQAPPPEPAKMQAQGGRAAQQQTRVLTRFQMQQRGNQLQIVDEDKSIYPGLVLAQGGGTNSFRVAGTNQTLQQSVVVTGQFYRASAPAQQLRQQPQQVGLAQDNYRVQGQAVVGNSNQIQIDAQAPTPAR